MIAMRAQHWQRRAGGFTIAELLVVIAIIAIVGTVSIVAIDRLSEDARRASATNLVMSVLDNARSYAIRENTIVLVAFRSQFDDGDDTFVEAVLCRWTGETYFDNNGGGGWLTDRFVPIPGIPPRALPSGFKVAAPRYEAIIPSDSSLSEYERDRSWIAQAELSAIEQVEGGGGEAGGAIVTVLFNSRGERVTLNPESDAIAAFIDWDDNIPDGGMRREGVDYPLLTSPVRLPFIRQSGYTLQRFPDDEPFVVFAPFLSVYNDREAREEFDTSAWINNPDALRDDLSAYINERADRLHFNRYSGVAMR